MAELATDPDFGTPQPLIAIVGTRRWPWSRSHPTVRFYIRADDDPRELEPWMVERLPPIAARVPEWAW